MSADLVFLDIETTGLDLWEDEPWEIFMRRRNADGKVYEAHLFVDHSYERRELMPEPFASDLRARYDLTNSVARIQAASTVYLFTEKAHLVGCVPDFDAYRLRWLMRGFDIEPAWHYHLIDVENLAVGFLAGLDKVVRPPWDSEEISRLLGIPVPPPGVRHTARGDVDWAQAIYDKVVAG